MKGFHQQPFYLGAECMSFGRKKPHIFTENSTAQSSKGIIVVYFHQNRFRLGKIRGITWKYA
jgi:hypothetical protein